MNESARGWTRGALGFVLLLTLALAACAPATSSRVEATPATGASGDPLSSSLRTYQTPTPTNTPIPSAPDCLASQLAGQFWLGGVGTGNMFGTIVMRNISSTACSMEGNQRTYGVATNGARVTTSLQSPPLPLERVVLPPHTPAASPETDLTPRAYLEIFLIGAYRDDPTGSSTAYLCTAANEVTPARFVVTIGLATLRVVNYDPVPGWANMHAIEGCHGAIGAGSAFLSS